MKPDKPNQDEHELLDQLARAFTDAGELLPTSEAEVEKEEAELDEASQLPAALREFKAPAPTSEPGEAAERPPARVHSLEARRKTPWLSYALTAALGAAAASLLFLWNAPRHDGTMGIAPSGELSARATDPEPPLSRIELSASACGAACCGGPSCAHSSEELKECPSGRTCIACGAPAPQERFRLKLGSLALTPAGSKLRDARALSALELCVRVGSSDFSCAPAHRNTDDETTWVALPLVASSQDGLAGFELEVRAQGALEPIAKWQGPVAINPTVLCKGLILRPKAGNDVFGTVSLFLDDTHYVELMRSDRVRPLVEYRGRFAGKQTLRIFERRGSEKPFALSVGPLSYGEAERLRWEIMNQGAAAKVVIGLDYLEGPAP